MINYKKIKEKQYLAERDIAKSLMSSPKNLRRKFYSIEYDKFFKSFPNNSSLTKRDKENAILQELKILKTIMKGSEVFVEIGAGDSLFSNEISKLFQEVIAIEVTSEKNKLDYPSNYKQIICNGIDLPIDDEYADYVFSDQVSEHLHPEDLIDQLKTIKRILKKGGVFEMITPNRLNGPHDVSKYFTDIASGLHLKEYDYRQLRDILNQIGLKKIKVIFKVRKLVLLLPINFLIIIEVILELIPRNFRMQMMEKFPIKQLFFMRILCMKN